MKIKPNSVQPGRVVGNDGTHASLGSSSAGNISVTPAEPSDSVALSHLHKTNFGPGFEFEAELRRDTVTVLKAEADCGPVGIALLEMASQTFQRQPQTVLSSLAVKESYRGRGIAKLLVVDCLERAREQGATELHLGVLEHNESAIKVYEKMGFVELPERAKRHFQDGEYHNVLRYKFPFGSQASETDLAKVKEEIFAQMKPTPTVVFTTWNPEL